MMKTFVAVAVLAVTFGCTEKMVPRDAASCIRVQFTNVDHRPVLAIARSAERLSDRHVIARRIISVNGETSFMDTLDISSDTIALSEGGCF